MSEYDVIIIGAGLGGLTAGAKLARSGKKVFLVEQHYLPGGCATVFKRKDFTMEVGLHEMDGLHAEDPKVEIFKDLQIFDNIELLEVPEFYRFTNDRVDIVLPCQVEQAIALLTQKFPNESKAINAFFERMFEIQKEVLKMSQEKWKVILLYPNSVLLPYGKLTLGEFLDSITDNEDLKLSLIGNLQYYHDDPYTLSLVYFCTAQASYFLGGGHFIKGGSQKLSDYLSSLITSNGGEVLLSHTVLKILTKDNVAIGIEYQKTNRKNSEIKKAYAPTIIANAAVPLVVDLLPPENQEVLRKKVSKLEVSSSLLSVYMGFKKEVKDLGNKSYATLVFDSSVKNLKDMIRTNKGPFENRNFVFVDYSQIDSALAPKGKSFGVICTVDYLTDWVNLTKEEYKKKKEEIAQMFFLKLEKLIPGIIKEIDYYEVATCKTITRYTLNPEGSVYGFAQTPRQSGIYRMTSKSPIANLYFASAWASPGGGFSGAILSGWNCAQELLKAKTEK